MCVAVMLLWITLAIIKVYNVIRYFALEKVEKGLFCPWDNQGVVRMYHVRKLFAITTRPLCNMFQNAGVWLKQMRDNFQPSTQHIFETSCHFSGHKRFLTQNFWK